MYKIKDIKLDNTNWLEVTFVNKNNEIIHCESFGDSDEYQGLLGQRCIEFGVELSEDNLLILEEQKKKRYTPTIKELQEIEVAKALKLEQEAFSTKWEVINYYLDNEIPNFINENTGNEFMIKTADLLWIEKESKEWTDEDSYSWIQFGIPTFQTNKNELKMAIADAKNKRQNKIAEIFELGA